MNKPGTMFNTLQLYITVRGSVIDVYLMKAFLLGVNSLVISSSLLRAAWLFIFSIVKELSSGVIDRW